MIWISWYLWYISGATFAYISCTLCAHSDWLIDWLHLWLCNDLLHVTLLHVVISLPGVDLSLASPVFAGCLQILSRGDHVTVSSPTVKTFLHSPKRHCGRAVYRCNGIQVQHILFFCVTEKQQMAGSGTIKHLLSSAARLPSVQCMLQAGEFMM